MESGILLLTFLGDLKMVKDDFSALTASAPAAVAPCLYTELRASVVIIIDAFLSSRASKWSKPEVSSFISYGVMPTYVFFLFFFVDILDFFF